MVYQILFVVFMLAGISCKIYAYHYNNYFFWKQFDSGGVLIAIAIIIIASRALLTAIVAWLYLALNINSFITSFFCDVTKFEINQQIFGWVVAGAFLLFGIVINAFKYILAKQVVKKNEACKKDAKDKYKNLINRIDHMETKISAKTNSLDDFLKRLTHG